MFKNSAGYLTDKEVTKDSKNQNDAFSTAEDSDNVRIPCGLSLLAYELYPNLLAVLRYN